MGLRNQGFKITYWSIKFVISRRFERGETHSVQWLYIIRLGVSCCDPEVKVAMRNYRHVRQGTGNDTMGQHPDRVAAETPIPTDWFGFAAQVRNTRSIHPAENLYELNVLKGIGWQAVSTTSDRVSQRGSAQVMK